MTVDDVMARTGLSRPSFYEYFRDRSHLIVKLVERLNERDRAVSARWFSDPDPVEGLQHSVSELVQSYAHHGHLLRALSDATHVYEEVEAQLSRTVRGNRSKIPRAAWASSWRRGQCPSMVWIQKKSRPRCCG